MNKLFIYKIIFYIVELMLIVSLIFGIGLLFYITPNTNTINIKTIGYIFITIISIFIFTILSCAISDEIILLKSKIKSDNILNKKNIIDW